MSNLQPNPLSANPKSLQEQALVRPSTASMGSLALTPPWFASPETWSPADLPPIFGHTRPALPVSSPNDPGGLGNIGIYSSPPSDVYARDRRRAKFRLRQTLRDIVRRWGLRWRTELRANNFVSTPEIDRLVKLAKIQTKCCGIREIPRKHRADRNDHVEIVVNKGIARWHMVRHCRNSRYCAVCADRKYAAEQQNIEKLNEICDINGWRQGMITLTRPHGRHDKLFDLLKNFSKAQRLLFGGKRWEKFRKLIGYIGMVRSEEILLGQNGWHPHQHINLIWKSSELDQEKIAKFIEKRWFSIGLKLGWCLSENERNWFFQHGSDVKFGKIDEGYLTKSLSYELTSADTKESKGLSIWKIIKKAVDEPFYDRKLQEFVEAVRGRPAIFWSRGLKKHIDLTDNDEKGEVLYMMSAYHFRKIGRHDLTLTILEAIEESNWQLINYYIENCGLIPVYKNC